MDLRKFKESTPSCAHLECNDDCDVTEAHCGRDDEACAEHNSRQNYTGLPPRAADTMTEPPAEMIESISREVVSTIATYIGNLIHNQKDAFYLRDRYMDAVNAVSQLAAFALTERALARKEALEEAAKALESRMTPEYGAEWGLASESRRSAIQSRNDTIHADAAAIRSLIEQPGGAPSPHPNP